MEHMKGGICMKNKASEQKWVNVSNHKIYDDGLWKVTSPGNVLSELVEVSKLRYIGLDDECYVYVCEDAPEEVKNLIVGELGDDTHVYMRVGMHDNLQVAQVWPY